jgi:hypothetical protein
MVPYGGMGNAHVFAPTISLFRRGCYSALRDIGARRERAAEVAGLSYSTAKRIDCDEDRCGMCGHVHDRKDHR